jgi:hypothetical protein
MLLGANPYVAVAPLAEFTKLLDLWMAMLDVVLDW